MKEVILRLKSDIRFPVDGSSISPDIFAGKSLLEIEALSVLVGNKNRVLRDIFEVSGEPAETASDQGILVAGNVTSFRSIGRGMSTGSMSFEDDAGFNVGEEMSGGTIKVKGSVELGAGTSMTGGVIEVQGNAGDQMGGSYRGKGKGMTGVASLCMAMLVLKWGPGCTEASSISPEAWDSSLVFA